MTDVAWKLHVVDRKDQQNAFVLSTGDIFVFTGLLQVGAIVRQTLKG
jgi:hypothetical protein